MGGFLPDWYFTPSYGGPRGCFDGYITSILERMDDFLKIYLFSALCYVFVMSPLRKYPLQMMLCLQALC